MDALHLIHIIGANLADALDSRRNATQKSNYRSELCLIWMQNIGLNSGGSQLHHVAGIIRIRTSHEWLTRNH